MKRILLAISIAALFLGCDERDSWKKCSQKVHPDPVKDSYIPKILGTVVMTNGDECTIEEVGKVYYDCYEFVDSVQYDKELECKYCKPILHAVARRLICKSGVITTNTIDYSHDKFRNELIY